MRSALIGHTGFVGGNLLRKRRFDCLFNSTSIDAIRGQSFDLLVCAGARAEKWKANRDPTADRAGIHRLIDCLTSVNAGRAILISTVDVFGSPIGVDESHPVDPAAATPYGQHRYELEQFFAARFDSLIVRLPALFGPGLKKNVIYDFLNRNNTEMIPSTGEFQFYDLTNLNGDLSIAERHGIRLLHCATEPISVADLALAAFGIEFHNFPPGIVPPRYDFRSRFAEQFGGSGGYLRRRDEVLKAVQQFVADERARQRDRRQCA